MNNILYEATSEFNYTIFIIPIIFVIALLIFPVVTKNYFEEKYQHKQNGKYNPEFVKKFCRVVLVFVIIISTIALVIQLDMYHKIVGAYNRGEYQIVEGYVENFDPMPYEGHKNESFQINGVKFSYSDYTIHPGYTNTKSHGGVIKKNGQHLKIGYVYINETYGNIIVYIEQIPD